MARVLGVAQQQQQQADHAVLTQQAISASFATVNNVEEPPGQPCSRRSPRRSPRCRRPNPQSARPNARKHLCCRIANDWRTRIATCAQSSPPARGCAVAPTAPPQRRSWRCSRNRTMQCVQHCRMRAGRCRRPLPLFQRAAPPRRPRANRRGRRQTAHPTCCRRRAAYRQCKVVGQPPKVRQQRLWRR